MIGLLLGAALAAAPVDLSGTWQIDEDASESIEPLLQARGASWLERQAIKHITVQHVITQQGDRVEVNIRSTVYSRQDVHLADGVARVRESERGGDVTVTDRWDEAGLVTESRMVLADGVPAVLTVRRTVVDDGATLRMDLALRAEDGRDVEVTRILRRLPAGG